MNTPAEGLDGFRMKGFFEDAGKIQSARNVGMPGSIEDEVKNLIRAALF